jgi:mRNA-degrading endonuclease RelE of RelBE toxin-antitoxin system
MFGLERGVNKIIISADIEQYRIVFQVVNFTQNLLIIKNNI